MVHQFHLQVTSIKSLTLITKSSPEEYVSIIGPGQLPLLQILPDEQRIKRKLPMISNSIKGNKRYSRGGSTTSSQQDQIRNCYCKRK